MNTGASGAPHRNVDVAEEIVAEYRVLSLSGGGVRGLFQACFLERLERDVGDLREHFDLIAATSTGAFVGLGIAAGVPVSKIVSLYTEHAAAIFKERAAALLRKGPRYTTEPVRAVLKQHLGDRLLGDLEREVLICASGLDRYQGKTFTRDDASVSLVDAALASGAAPTFFAPVVPDGSHRGYIDGGLWANDPLLVAVAHAHSRGIDPTQIEALAVGTGRVTKGVSAEHVASMRPLSTETARFMIDTAGSLQEWSDSRVLEQLTATAVHRVNPELTDWIGLDDSKAATQKLPGLAEVEYERYGEEVCEWLRNERRAAPKPIPPLPAPLEDGIRAAGVSRFMPARRYYAIYRDGRESISSYIRRTKRTLTMVSINLAVGGELERIERVFAELLDEDPAICIRVSLLDPTDSALMEVIGSILDMRPDRISERIAETMTKLIEFRDGLEGDLRPQVELFNHRTIPSASAILIDANTDDGVIQLETKPYKAPATSSWAFELEAGTEFFETMREAYHALVEDGKEV